MTYRKVAKIAQRVPEYALPRFPYVNTLKNYGMFVKTKKLTLVHYC